MAALIKSFIGCLVCRLLVIFWVLVVRECGNLQILFYLDDAFFGQFMEISGLTISELAAHKRMAKSIFGGGSALHIAEVWGIQLILIVSDKWLAPLFLYLPLFIINLVHLIERSRVSTLDEVLKEDKTTAILRRTEVRRNSKFYQSYIWRKRRRGEVRRNSKSY